MLTLAKHRIKAEPTADINIPGELPGELSAPRKGSLIAQWHIVDGKLVCQWIVC